MGELFVWWLVVEAIGVAAFPLTFVLFHRLPDRGFAFAKAIGLLLLGYALWTGATAGLLTNSRGSVLLLLLLMAGLALVVTRRHRSEMASFLRDGWRYVLFVEAMFLLVLAAAVFLRSFAPQIDSGEKPFELAFLNSINRTETYPPPDPWLAGHSISYYYFGYVIISALTKLTALSTSVTFFLGLSLVAALTWVSAFGLVYNLVVISRRRGASESDRGPALVPRAVVFGLVAAVLVLVVSNLEGVFELTARHGVGSRGFYDFLGISGLPGPYDCSAAPGDCAEWYPTRSYWWWWATRMGSGFDIQEFPFFSLHFGDLHAHVMAMPFLTTLFALAFQTVLGAGEASGPGERFDILWIARRPGRFLFVALLVGGIAFTDAWAAPLAALMVVASVLVANWLRAERSPWRVLIDSAGLAVPVLAAAFLLYLPFYLHLESDTRSLDVTQLAAASAGVPTDSLATRPLHFLLFWGPLLWVGLSFVALYLRRQGRRLLAGPLPWLAMIPWAAPAGLYALLVASGDGLGGLADELQERGANLITLGMLAAAITAVALCFLQAARRPARERDRSDLFVFLLMGFALTMLLGAELYFVKDLLGWRANTVFRFWHQSWIILGIAGAFGLYRLTAGWRLPELRLGQTPWRYLAGWGIAFGLAYTIAVAVDPWETLYSRWWTATPGLIVAGVSIFGYAVALASGTASRGAAWGRIGWLAATAVILGAALVYPVLVAFDRTGGFRNAQTVDGLAFAREEDPAEYEAIQWLNGNVGGTPVILEAAGDDFSGFGRVSSRTGLPTVIGWLGHEMQWRGRPDAISAAGSETPFTLRPEEVSRVYATTDVQEAESIMAKYEVEYVYVGRLERQKYGEAGLEKFGQFMTRVFQNAEVSIYHLPPPPTSVRR